MSHPLDDLTALLDGALPPARHAEVERHLAGCASCRAERDRLAGAVARLAALPPPPEPSPWFLSKLEARLADEPPPARGILASLAAWKWRLAVPATAVAAAAAMAVFAVRQQRADEAALAQHLELLEEYEVVASLGDVETAEDAAVVASLDELSPRKEGRP